MEKLKSYSSKKMFILYTVLVTGHRILGLLTPIVTQKLIDAISLNDISKLQFYGLIDMAIMILFILFLAAANYIQECYENATILLQKKDFALHLNNFPYEKFYQKGTGYYIQRFHSDIENCRPFIINKKVNFWVQGIYLLAIIFMMLKIDITYAISLFSIFPLIMICYKYLAKKVGKLTGQIEDIQDKMNTHIEEMIYCDYSLRVNNSAEWFASKMDNFILNSFRVKQKRSSVETVYDFIFITGLLNLLSVAVYYFGGMFVLGGKITIGMVVAMSLYYAKLWSPLEFYLDYPKEKSKYNMYKKRINEVMQDAVNDTGYINNKSLITKMREINIQDLTYSVGEKEIFKDFSMSIRQGDRIGIMGSNGCGKTTLANLICGLLQNYQGNITYNGVDYNQISLKSLREHICLIPATPQLFSGTIYENITMGKKEEIPEQLIDILRQKELYQENILLEHGSNLSGGEAKLIQLLRGIYRKCDLYIIDEPLNYIDTNYTELIIKVMQELFIEKTLMIISHDKRVFPLCNRVYKLSEGVFEDAGALHI